MADYIYSVDLGKIGDYHAHVLTEIRTLVREREAQVRQGILDNGREDILYPEVHVRYLGRNQDSYPEVVKTVKERMQDPMIINNCDLVVDATGVGMPVIDYMVAEGLDPIGIWITSGAQVGDQSYGYTVPKGDLIASLQTALSLHSIQFSKYLDPKCVKQIKHEFSMFTEKRTKKGHETFNSLRESDHDDLVLSLAINIWRIYQTHGIKVQRRGRIYHSAKDYNPLKFGLS